jgi:hypothetical protein
MLAKYNKACVHCGVRFEATRRHARFCSDGCRGNYHKKARLQTKGAELGGRCSKCNRTARKDDGQVTLYVHGEPPKLHLLCGACRFKYLCIHNPPTRMYKSKKKRWVFVHGNIVQQWEQEYIENLPDDEERERYYAQKRGTNP